MGHGWTTILKLRGPIGALAGLVVFFVLPETMTLASRIALGWLCYIAVQLAVIFRTVGGQEAASLRTWAPRADLHGAGFGLFLVAAACVSVMASVFVLHVAADQPEAWRLFHLLLGAATVLLTWFAIQAAFAVHYASMYYGGHGEPGLRFPDEDEPDFWDFLYFATCAGMTFEASDVAVTRRRFRHWLTFHAVFSFVFASINLALLVDIAANLV